MNTVSSTSTIAVIVGTTGYRALLSLSFAYCVQMTTCLSTSYERSQKIGCCLLNIALSWLNSQATLCKDSAQSMQEYVHKYYNMCHRLTNSHRYHKPNHIFVLLFYLDNVGYHENRLSHINSCFLPTIFYKHCRSRLAPSEHDKITKCRIYPQSTYGPIHLMEADK